MFFRVEPPAVAVFSTPDRNAWGAVPASIIRARAQVDPPLPGQPGPFSLGDPGRLEGLLRAAGFAAPEAHLLPAAHRAGSAAEYLQVAREAFGGFNAMMAHLPYRECESVWDQVQAALRRFESPAGFEASGECLVVAATK
ncbi:MAG: hypothetical protein AMXMBFR66_08060 [Pseudomonadota bacterium]|nr:hypothetical protein [Rubrivivax sp.]NLZ42776.1 hypothetical protein [Comamonadaceae bacterium]